MFSMRKCVLLILLIVIGCRQSPKATKDAAENAKSKYPVFYLKAPASVSPLKISREYSPEVKADVSKITWKNIDGEKLYYQDFRKAALIDVAATRLNGVFFNSQSTAIRCLLTTHTKTAVNDVMRLLLECAPQELFPPGADKWTVVPGDSIMMDIRLSLRGSNCVPPPLPLDRAYYTIDNLPLWKKWWEENKDKIPAQWPAN